MFSDVVVVLRGIKLSLWVWRVLRVTGRRSPWVSTKRSPRVILYWAVRRLSIRGCSRVRQPSSSSMVVTLSVLLHLRRHHRAAQRCTISILYAPLFSTRGQITETNKKVLYLLFLHIFTDAKMSLLRPKISNFRQVILLKTQLRMKLQL